MTLLVEQLGLDDGATLGLLLRRFYPDVLASAFGDAEDLLALDLAFDVASDAVQAVLDQLLLQARGITETTKDELRTLIGQQAAEGWSAEELADQIRAAAPGMARRRAAVIAVTETASAYSRGSLLAYRQSGVVSELVWMTAPSEDACPICKPLDGKTVLLDQEFAPGIRFPPAHPQCRCAIAPI